MTMRAKATIMMMAWAIFSFSLCPSLFGGMIR